MSEIAHGAASVTTSEDDRKELEPGPRLYRAVLGAFVARTERPRSLEEWCRMQEPRVSRGTASSVLHGQYDNDEARALRERILRAAGLIEEAK